MLPQNVAHFINKIKTFSEIQFVLVRREVRENCTLQKEFCETSHRNQRVDSDTVLCQLEYDIDCDDSDDEDDLTGRKDLIGGCSQPRRGASNVM